MVSPTADSRARNARVRFAAFPNCVPITTATESMGSSGAGFLSGRLFEAFTCLGASEGWVVSGRRLAICVPELDLSASRV